MKTIGLIGGMSWESTAEYYRIINEAIRERLGGSHSAKIVLYSVEFEEVREYHHKGKWDEATMLMIDAAKRVERGGADFALICTNTMHKMADDNVHRELSRLGISTKHWFKEIWLACLDEWGKISCLQIW
jgi:Aspartate racemase